MVWSVVSASVLAVLHLAQPESAVLSGTVVDASGDRIADVEITVSCGDRVRTVQSDAEGRFSFADLVATDCLIIAERPFFATLVTPVDLRVERNVRLSLEVAIEIEVVVTPSGGARETEFGVYPGFPTLFWGLSVFFVGDLMGKVLWKLVENAARFPRRGGRVLCVHGAVSFHRARPCGPRWLPGRGAMRHVELDRRVLGLQSTDE